MPLSNISPPVGKSGPGIEVMSVSTVISGLSIVCIIASHVSVRLCGGMFVAIPTAIPALPFTSRFGIFAGSTVGSLSVPSKFGVMTTVSFSMPIVTGKQ